MYISQTLQSTPDNSYRCNVTQHGYTYNQGTLNRPEPDNSAYTKPNQCGLGWFSHSGQFIYKTLSTLFSWKFERVQHLSRSHSHPPTSIGTSPLFDVDWCLPPFFHALDKLSLGFHCCSLPLPCRPAPLSPLWHHVSSLSLTHSLSLTKGVLPLSQ